MITALWAELASPGTSEIGGTGEQIFFWVTSTFMVLGAMGLLIVRKAVHAALCMAVVMVNLGLVYLAVSAPFLGVVQVFVYTGAVMMLFLFVLMLVGVDASDSRTETLAGQRPAAILMSLGLGSLLISALGSSLYPKARDFDVTQTEGNITAMAIAIFGDYVWAFEVTSALLITAALGAMVLAHRENTTPKLSQREQSELRIAQGAIKAPLPAPGVYARHNAVDTPALLPDGSASEISVSRVLGARGQNRPLAGEREQVEAHAEDLKSREDS